MDDRPLTDDEIETLINRPDQIESREQGWEIIEIIDAEIANIDAQIAVAESEGRISPLSEDRRDWLRRAAYARAMKANERDRVYRRCKYFRFMKGPDNQESTEAAKTKAEANRIKQERLKIEGEAKRLKRANEAETIRLEQMKIAQLKREIKARQSLQHHFVQIAAEHLLQLTYDEIMNAARDAARKEMADG